jgi:transposase
VLEGRIRSLVQLSGSSLPTITGVAAITAAKLLGETGEPRRYRAYSGLLRPDEPTSPQPGRQPTAQSGPPHDRPRPGPDRSARPAYMARRMAEGKSWLEALRCLKRHLADVVLRTMLADVERSAAAGA